MGGDCIGSDLVLHSTGIDYVKCVIQVACGIKPDISQVCDKKTVSSRFIFSKEDLDILQKINPQQIIRIAYLDEDALGCATDSSNRAGCYVMME